MTRLEELDVSNIGNIVRTNTGPHFMRPEGHVLNSTLTLKVYQMYAGEPFGVSTVEYSRAFLHAAIDSGEIKPESGLGYAILSKGFLNVVRWNLDPKREIPSILPLADLFTWEKEPTTEQGLFVPTRGSMERGEAECVWERGISAFEDARWTQYLRTRGSQDDKIAYVAAMMAAQELYPV